MSDFEVGDVVYCEGASAIKGDVVEVLVEDGVNEPGIKVRWRETETVENTDDLHHVQGWQARRMLRPE